MYDIQACGLQPALVWMQGVEEAENKRLREENKTKKFAERGVWDKNKNKNLTEEVYRERVSERKKQKQNQVVRRERERVNERKSLKQKQDVCKRVGVVVCRYLQRWTSLQHSWVPWFHKWSIRWGSSQGHTQRRGKLLGRGPDC